MTAHGATDTPSPDPDALRLIARDGGFVLPVKVVPGSSRQRIAGRYADGIKITVRAVAEGGAANQAVLSVLADALQIAPANVRIVRGHTSPRKDVAIVGLSAKTIQERLMPK